MRWVTTLAGAAALLGIGAFGASGSDRLPASVTPAQLHDMQQHGVAPLIIDVRTPEEFAEGHIPGAVNIPHEEVAERVPNIDAPRGIVLYCTIGPRALRAESALREAGETRLFHLEGGLTAWERAGYSVSR
jgi:rhodanese-related sulfurtransferase